MQSEELRREWLQSWADDLEEYPADVIEHAFRAWERLNTAYMPYQVGQLRPFLDAVMSKRRFVAMATCKALDAIEAGNVERPKPQPVAQSEKPPMPNFKADRPEPHADPLVQKPAMSKDEMAARLRAMG
jgi:hypothetical protein